jgi:hypothetical protein
MEMGILAMQKLHHLINGDSEMSVKSVVYGELEVRESSGGSLARGEGQAECVKPFETPRI